MNLRLIKTSIYFFQFRFDVRYRLDKKHIISNVLFRLSIDRSFLNEKNLNLKNYNINITNSLMNNQCLIYNDIFINMSKVFRDQLLIECVKKKTWINFITMFIDLKKRINRKKSFQSIKIEINDENIIKKKKHASFSRIETKKNLHRCSIQFKKRFHLSHRRTSSFMYIVKNVFNKKVWDEF